MKLGWTLAGFAKSRRFVVGLLVAILTLLAPAGMAATPLTAEGLIKVDVTVTDNSGRPVSGLTPQDFRILDDGFPTTILSWDSSRSRFDVTNTSVEVVLVIDAINQNAEQIGHVAQEIENFLRQSGGHLAEPVSLVLVSNNGLSFQPQPSIEGNALAAVISHLKTNIDPAKPPATLQELERRFELSILQMMVIARKEAHKPGRKLLIWIGPGWAMPTCSSLPRAQDRVRCGLGMAVRPAPDLTDQQRYFYQIVELGSLLREGRTSVYRISLPGDESPGPEAESYRKFLKGVESASQAKARNLSLDVLAVQSGGEVRKSGNGAADLIASCVRDAENFYTLSFDPPETTRINEYHDLHIAVDRPDLTVRTYSGYYDQPGISIKYLALAQLAHVIETMKEILDREAARQLSRLVLTERLSGTALSSLNRELPGPKAQRMLLALADASTFLSFPASEVPRKPPPNVSEQQMIVSRAVEYLGKTIPKLPNLFASRTTVHYNYVSEKSDHSASGDFADGYWGVGKTYYSIVLYRDGKEIIQSTRGKELSMRTQEQEEGLLVFGAFGPVLSMVVADAGVSALTWSHWEPGAAGPLAVFHVAVSKSRSHYDTDYHSLVGGRSKVVHLRSAYHAEITIDPETGTIYRLALMADPDPSTPIVRSDVMVQYGPVEIAGVTYICPIKTVSLSQEDASGFAFRKDEPPNLTFLNEITFANYHVFRSNSRITTPEDEKMKP